MAGFNKFVLDKRLLVIEHRAGDYSKRLIDKNLPGLKSNFNVMRLYSKYGYKANTYKFEESDKRIIMTGPPDGHRFIYGKDFEDWFNWNRVFNLRKLREGKR